jgi:hypothetical protein
MPNVVDIRGGHPQAAGGNNPHGKGLFSAKQDNVAWKMKSFFTV